MDKFKWIKEHVKREHPVNIIQSPDGSLFEIIVRDDGALSTTKHNMRKLTRR